MHSSAFIPVPPRLAPLPVPRAYRTPLGWAVGGCITPRLTRDALAPHKAPSTRSALAAACKREPSPPRQCIVTETGPGADPSGENKPESPVSMRNAMVAALVLSPEVAHAVLCAGSEARAGKSRMN